MLLCVANIVPKLINNLGRSLQQSGFQFSCGSSNVLDVIGKTFVQNKMSRAVILLWV